MTEPKLIPTNGSPKRTVCVIECIFGKGYADVYPAPAGYDSYLFSNNPKAKKRAEKQGWKFIAVDLPLTGDYVVSSMQSKYVKFLQFLKEPQFAYFKNYDYLLYLDHKYNVESRHIEQLLSISKKPLLLRNYWSNNHHLWEEIYGAMKQERYFKQMAQTVDFVRNRIGDGKENPPVYLTAVLLYQPQDEAMLAFIDEVYAGLMETGTAECQIIFSVLASNHLDKIQVIDYESLDIPRLVPRNFWLRTLKRIAPRTLLKKYRQTKYKNRNS